MKKASPSVPPKLVRDPRTGEVLELRGFGALKGKLTLRKGLDLTKPIYEQVVKLDEAEAGRTAKR